MKNNLLFLAFIFVFHHLFWEEVLGLNLVVFSLAAIILQYLHHGVKSVTKIEILIAASYLVSAAGVLIVNTAVSQLVCIVAFVTYLGHLKLRQTSTLEGFLNGVYALPGWRKSLLPSPVIIPGKRRPAGILYTKLAIIPLLFFIFYVVMFTGGNSIFRDWTNSTFGSMIDYIADISWAYFFFLLLGIVLVRWFFLKTIKPLLNFETGSQLIRKKNKTLGEFTRMGLKHEYITAIMMFGLLNVLFAVVNFIDVRWVWFQFYVPADFSLKEFVHDGVGYLIVTLLISMGLIFFFFRKNLNFYPKSKLLKVLGYAWIVQNAILAISVVIRTVHYINFHGLASGRIGLMVFLSLVIFGLTSLFFKIALKKNNAYVFRVNSAFALTLFAGCSLVNWDGMIARINLNHAMANEIDVDNYLRLNPQVYPFIFENLDKVEKQIRYHNHNEVRWIKYRDISNFKEVLILRSEAYLNKRSQLSSFDSWSYADQKAVRQLSKIL